MRSIDPGNFTTHWKFGLTCDQVERRRESMIRALTSDLDLTREQMGFLKGQLKMLGWLEGLPDLLFPRTSSTHGADDDQPPHSSPRFDIPLSSR